MDVARFDKVQVIMPNLAHRLIFEASCFPTEDQRAAQMLWHDCPLFYVLQPSSQDPHSRGAGVDQQRFPTAPKRSSRKLMPYAAPEYRPKGNRTWTVLDLRVPCLRLLGS